MKERKKKIEPFKIQKKKKNEYQGKWDECTGTDDNFLAQSLLSVNVYFNDRQTRFNKKVFKMLKRIYTSFIIVKEKKSKLE